MLKFLTQKLKTQSLNEEDQQFNNKAQDDHDSGTESDDESGEPNGFPGDNNVMEHEEDSEWAGSGFYPLPGGRGSIHCNDEVGPGAGEMMMMMGGGGGGDGRDSASSQFEVEPGYLVDSALPSDSDHAYDHHSSEEELEVINSTSYDEVDDEVNLPEEGEELLGLLGDEDQEGIISCRAGNRHGGPTENCKRKWSQMASNRLSVESTSSSDDEVQGLLRPLSTPVEFRTSPPVDAHKPSRSQSPPPKLFLFSGPNPPPIVSSTTAGGDESSTAANVITAAVAPSTGGSNQTSPISSNVVSSSLITSSVPGALMDGRGHGVFRGIRRFTEFHLEDKISNSYPFSINLSMGSGVSGTNSSGLGALDSNGAFERSDGANNRSQLINTNINETTPTTNFITNLSSSASTMITRNSNNSTSALINSSTSTGAFGKVVRSAGGSSHPGGNSPPAILSPSADHRTNSNTNTTSSTRESSRKRHRHHNPRHIQRPWLDFEKMQQVSIADFGFYLQCSTSSPSKKMTDKFDNSPTFLIS